MSLFSLSVKYWSAGTKPDQTVDTIKGKRRTYDKACQLFTLAVFWYKQMAQDILNVYCLQRIRIRRDGKGNVSESVYMHVESETEENISNVFINAPRKSRLGNQKP